ncbi:MAG: hypothetical protein WC878_00450 [Candidatus Paceibacterota bacterium]|jgi:hypothetical protein
MHSLTAKKLISYFFLTISLSSVLFLLPFSLSVNPINSAFAAGAATQNGLDTVEQGLKNNCGFITGDIESCFLLIEFWIMVSIPRWIYDLASNVYDTVWAFGLSSDTFSLGGKTDNFVNIGWVVCRDVANTFFIFILLYIAIMTIIGQLGGNLKSFLSTLIVVALLINFSMFITRFVVDVGNIFAIEFYSTFPLTGDTGTCPPVHFKGIEEHCISAGFQNALFQPLIEIIGNINMGASFTVKAVAIAFAGLELLVINFIFLIASFFLLGRVVAIWILMILAPLAFFSHILPFFKGKIWGPWLSHLISQTFFPAIFLFFVYIAMRMATSDWLMGVFGASKTPEITVESFLRIGLQFATINFFLIFGLKQAKEMSGTAGSMASKFGMGAVLGGAAIAGRQIGGRLATWAKSDAGLGLDKKWGTNRFGRFALKYGPNWAAEGNWDARSSTIGGLIAKNTGADMGQAGGQGGFAGQRQVAGREILGGFNALKGDPKRQVAYAANLQKTFGGLDIAGKSVRINADRDTKALFSQLNFTERKELMEAAKGTKYEAYLKKVNASLGEDMTPGQQIEDAKAQFELMKNDPRGMAEFAEGLHKEGKDSYLGPMMKGLTAKEMFNMENSATDEQTREFFKTKREETFAKLKPLQRAQMEKEFRAEENLGAFKASLKNYKSANDEKLKTQYNKEVVEKLRNLRSQQVLELDGEDITEEPVLRGVSADTVRMIKNSSGLTQKQAEDFDKGILTLNESEQARDIVKYGLYGAAKKGGGGGGTKEKQPVTTSTNIAQALADKGKA